MMKLQYVGTSANDIAAWFILPPSDIQYLASCYYCKGTICPFGYITALSSHEPWTMNHESGFTIMH